MIDQHVRMKVWGKDQHPYNHSVSEFLYSNPALPGVSNIARALDYMIAVLYPNTKDAVANKAALPTVGNTLNDYRVVTDDGDGKAASYRWEQREGDGLAKWYKVYDMDWGQGSILSAFLDKTQDVYVYRYGYDDLDDSGTPLAGVLSGQHIYGGASAGTHLTLFANSGDGVGVGSGFIQLGDHTRPLADNSYDLGTAALSFKNAYLKTLLTVGTTTVGPAVVNDTSGNFSFSALNLTTTGTVSGAKFLAGAGAVGAPALGFTADPTTGFYQPAASETALALGGVLSAKWSAAGVQALDGGFSFLSETGSGLYRAGASDIRLKVAGTARLKATATGVDLGLGVAYVDASNSRFGVLTTTPQTDFHLLKATTPQMRIESANSAGSSPGEIQFYASRAAGANLQGTDDLGYLDFYGKAAGSMNWLAAVQGKYRGDGSTLLADLIFSTANGGLPAEKVRIRYDGNVGIGVTNPVYPLQVSGSAAAANFLLQVNSISATNTDGGIALVPNGVGRVTAAVGLDPSGAVSLGQAATRWVTLFVNNVGDGTNLVTSAVLASFRDANVGVADGMSLFWSGGKWVASLPDTEIVHGTISGLTADDHTQYALLAGRGTGQTLKGGTASGNNLTLQSTSHATQGSVLVGSDLSPVTDNARDLGATATRWKDLYLAGQLVGARLQNSTTAGRPAASGTTKGRMIWDTDLLALYVDQGGTWAKIGAEKAYIQDAVTWTGAATAKTYTVDGSDGTVTGKVTDARLCNWQLKDNGDTFKIRKDCEITMTATTVTVTFNADFPPAAGTYTLVGVG